jgi:mRNA-degrading endonuclease HigB of HigAB toxin-antitoxin module
MPDQSERPAGFAEMKRLFPVADKWDHSMIGGSKLRLIVIVQYRTKRS